MQLISFAFTPQQLQARTKRVTRRKGWLKLKPGTLLQACGKVMGRRKGEPLIRYCVIRVVSVRREPLSRMATSKAYGRKEARLEGFPWLTGLGFVKMFCEHMNAKPDDYVTRIEFEYVDETSGKKEKKQMPKPRKTHRAAIT